MPRENVAWILTFMDDLKQVAKAHGLDALAHDLDDAIMRHGDDVMAVEASVVSAVDSTSTVDTGNVVSLDRHTRFQSR